MPTGFPWSERSLRLPRGTVAATAVPQSLERGICVPPDENVTPANDPDFLISTILPAHEIHLLGGPSGAGKTRWLLDTLLNWERGQPVLGFPSRPVPWAYAACDRGEASIRRTLEDMGIEPKRIPLIAGWDRGMTISQVIGACEERRARLLIIEAFGSFVAPPGHANCVKQLLRPLHNMIQRSGLTIIGIMESPKQKPYEVYENPRQRISGVAAWAHFTETIILVEFLHAGEVMDPRRRLTVCPRNAPSFQKFGQFDGNGRIEFVYDVATGSDGHSKPKTH